MDNPKRIFSKYDLVGVRELLASLAKPGETMDEAFFRILVEHAVLEHKAGLEGAAFDARLHADWIDPVVRSLGQGSLEVSWTWVEGEELDLPMPS